MQTPRLSRFLAFISADGISVAFARAFSILCSLAIMALAARRFSSEEFGLWALLTPLVSIILSLDLGFGNATRNRLVGTQQAEANADFSSAFYFLCLLVLVYWAISTLIWMTGSYRLIFTTNDARIRSTGSLLLFLSTLIVMVRIPLFLGLNSFFSYHEAKYNAVFDALIWASTLVATAIATTSKIDIISAVVAYHLAAGCASSLAFAVFVSRRRWKLIWPQDGWRRIRGLIKVSLPFAFLQFFAMISNYAATFAVGAVVGVQEMGPYRGAVAICSAIVGLQLAYIMPLWTQFTHIHITGKRSELSAQLFKAFAQTSLVIVPLTLFIALGPWILRTWLGIPFHDRSLLVILAVTTFFQVMANTVSILLNGVGRPELTLYSLIPGSILCIPLALFMGQRYSVDGVALSFMFSAGLTLILIAAIAWTWWREQSQAPSDAKQPAR